MCNQTVCLVAAELERRGIAFVRRSEVAVVPAGCGYVLGDSFGEMAAYYASCDLALIGGSLLPYGSQNLIEACAAGVPVLVGPSTYNFAQAAVEAVHLQYIAGCSGHRVPLHGCGPRVEHRPVRRRHLRGRGQQRRTALG